MPGRRLLVSTHLHPIRGRNLYYLEVTFGQNHRCSKDGRAKTSDDKSGGYW